MVLECFKDCLYLTLKVEECYYLYLEEVEAAKLSSNLVVKTA